MDKLWIIELVVWQLSVEWNNNVRVIPRGFCSTRGRFFHVPTGSVFEVSLWGPSMLFDVPGQELAGEVVCLSSRGTVRVCFQRML